MPGRTPRLPRWATGVLALLAQVHFEIQTKLPEPTIPSRACLSSPFDGLVGERPDRHGCVVAGTGPLAPWQPGNSAFAYSVHAKSRSGPEAPFPAALCGTFIAGLPLSLPIRRRSREEEKKRPGEMGNDLHGTYQVPRYRVPRCLYPCLSSTLEGHNPECKDLSHVHARDSTQSPRGLEAPLPVGQRINLSGQVKTDE